jgi:hypothetical protein
MPATVPLPHATVRHVGLVWLSCRDPFLRSASLMSTPSRARRTSDASFLGGALVVAKRPTGLDSFVRASVNRDMQGLTRFGISGIRIADCAGAQIGVQPEA